VKFKLDENFGQRCVALFREAGHDVATVASQRLCGTEDANLFDVCHRENRCLVTLDMDFANPMQFPPVGSPGVAVVRVPGTVTAAKLASAKGLLLETVDSRPIAGKLWIVEATRLREYQHPDRDDD
jgi:predicted nuclease of predicted toxin-antitoxin system